MPPIYVSAPTFPLLTGEQLYALEDGTFVTVRITKVEPQRDPAFVAFDVTGRQLTADGAPRMVQGAFDPEPVPVTLPRASCSIANAALSLGLASVTDSLAQWTSKALSDWVGYLAAHTAILNFPTA